MGKGQGAMGNWEQRKKYFHALVVDFCPWGSSLGIFSYFSKFLYPYGEVVRKNFVSVHFT
ncbi:MAG: hypothetical protein KME30_17075 [Iphinoe sp. HA4291-MV1]|jgi:hypothetical protein|nr:hypothetical protein [Iphinoe sp. HA4291-MV1]